MSTDEDILFKHDKEYNSLKIATLKNVAEISPYINEVTIGPSAKVLNEMPTLTNGIPKTSENNALNGGHAIQTSPKSDIYSNSIYIDRLLHEHEIQQKQTMDVMVRSMLNKMVTKRSEMLTRFRHQQELENERKIQERRNREREILQQLALGDRMAQLEQERLDAENRAHNERMKKLLEKQLKSTQMVQDLDRNHLDISRIYQDITNIPETDNKDVYIKVLQNYDPLLTTLLNTINSLAENCKSGNITAVDVSKSEVIKNKMSEIKDGILLEYQQLIRKHEDEKKAAEIEKQIVESKKVSQQVTEAQKTKKEEENLYCSKISLEHYLELQKHLQTYEESFKDLVNDNSFKKFRFDLQKAVNIPVNSISSVSGSHLKDKFDKLVKLLNGERVKVGDAYVSCSLHPQGRAYCMDLLAKKLVKQGEQTVSSNPEAAYPIASITVALWAKFPELGNLILAYFNKECPYLVPLFLPKCDELSNEEYYTARGYRYDENGAVEKQDKFLKRMSGIFRLNAAIWITKMPYSVKMGHPQSLKHAWRWMAAFINLNPEADITATLLFDFLSVCGAEFFKYYKQQFVKVLSYLVNDYQKRINKIDEGGPKVRLEVFLQNVMKEGTIHPPEGLLSGSVW